MARLPTTCPFNGQDVTLWTYEQLEVSSKLNLKQRALNLRELVGEGQLPPLKSGGPNITIVRHPHMRALTRVARYPSLI